MTYHGKFRLLLIFCFLASLLLLACLLGIGMGLFGGGRPSVTPAQLALVRLSRGLNPLNARAANAAVAGFFCLYSLISCLMICRAFRKSASNEIVFLALFLCCLSFEGLRPVLAQAAAQSWADGYQNALSRLVYWARWLGMLSLLLASLYAAGLAYEHGGRALSLILALGLIVVSAIPLDSGRYAPGFLVSHGQPSVLAFAWVALELVTIVNYLLAAYLNSSRDFAYSALSCLCISLGRDMAIACTDQPLILCAMALVAFGGLAFLSRFSQRVGWD